ncbi:MAG: hypothetical protein KDK78_03000 [Chlamydiia bacterium]|nr:hypothetical protein [Chlamydiia bacterium]
MRALLLVCLFSLSSLGALERAFVQDPEECVLLQGIYREGNQYVIKLYNNCDEKRHITICIDQGFGKYRTVKSFQRVSPGSVFGAYTLPGYRPVDAWWVSSPDPVPPVPPCSK